MAIVFEIQILNIHCLIVFNKLQEKYLLTPNLNLQILLKSNPQILQKSSLKSIKSNKKYEINREKIINFIIHILFSKKVITGSNILFYAKAKGGSFLEKDVACISEFRNLRRNRLKSSR